MRTLRLPLAGTVISVLLGGLVVTAAAQPDDAGAAGAFAPAASLAEAREWHTATSLPDGRVLVIGGYDGEEPLATSELWDPEAAAFVPAGDLAEARDYHTATLLPDGRVLVVGGVDGEYLATAELWEPEAAAFLPAGDLAEARAGHPATLLPDGRVLVVGGTHGKQFLATAELWEPEAAAFLSAGSLAEARAAHTATALPDGRVLVVGGWDGKTTSFASAELWDPEAAAFLPAGDLAEARELHTATRLPDGRVLVVGGVGEGGKVLATAELWDPEVAAFLPAGDLAAARFWHAATALPDGRVLVVGGVGEGGEVLATAELWEPAPSATSTTEPTPGPWVDVELPPVPALVPEAGYEALGSVDTFCVDLGFDPATTGVLQEPHFSSALAFLGFEVVESGCDARLEVTLVADWPASPAQYSGDLTCYLDDRSATATATLVVGDEVMGRWESEGNAGAPFTIFSGGCPGPDDPVDVSFMDDPVNESWLGPVFGKVGRAAVAEAGYDLPRFTGLLVGEDGHTVDEQVMAIWVNYLQDENLRGRVMEIHDAFDELAADGQSPPAGIEVLVPLLLRTITDPAMSWEDSLGDAWQVIAWITGIEDEDPDAVWAWYAAHLGLDDPAQPPLAEADTLTSPSSVSGFTPEGAILTEEVGEGDSEFCELARSSTEDRDEDEVSAFYEQLAVVAPDEIRDEVETLRTGWNSVSFPSGKADLDDSDISRPAEVSAAAQRVIEFVGSLCGSDGGSGVYLIFPDAAVPTVPVGPPCFGLEQVDRLPEWFGGLAFGEVHSTGAGNTIDLLSKVGCRIEGGVLVVSETGVFDEAYAEDCDGLEADDIPRPELRPAADKLWLCTQPLGDGGFFQRLNWPDQGGQAVEETEEVVDGGDATQAVLQATQGPISTAEHEFVVAAAGFDATIHGMEPVDGADGDRILFVEFDLLAGDRSTFEDLEIIVMSDSGVESASLARMTDGSIEMLADLQMVTTESEYRPDPDNITWAYAVPDGSIDLELLLPSGELVDLHGLLEGDAVSGLQETTSGSDDPEQPSVVGGDDGTEEVASAELQESAAVGLAQEDGPEATIQDLMSALEAWDFEALPTFLCEEFADDMDLLDLASLTEGLPPGTDVDMALDALVLDIELATELISQTDSEAVVRVDGSMSVDIDIEALAPFVESLLAAAGEEVTPDRVDTVGRELTAEVEAESEDVSSIFTLVPGETRAWLVCGVVDMAMGGDVLAEGDTGTDRDVAAGADLPADPARSSEAPLAPTDVQLSAAAGSVAITWTARPGAPPVDRYVVLRDGAVVGETAGEDTSYVDASLTPGTEYGYEVVAVVGTQRSEPTAMTTAWTRAPSPVDLVVRPSGADRFSLRWSSPPDSPQPDTYVILRNGKRVGTVPGTATSYVDSGFARGSRYRYRVAATWAGNVSAPSATVKVKSFAAPLQGSWQVAVKNTATPGGSVKVGDRWTESWVFTPTCVDRTCPVWLKGHLAGQRFKVKLRPKGGAYTGTGKAWISSCGEIQILNSDTETFELQPRLLQNTLTFRLTRGRGEGGLWTSWRGSLQVRAPRANYLWPPGSLLYCPAQSWRFRLTSR